MFQSSMSAGYKLKIVWILGVLNYGCSSDLEPRSDVDGRAFTKTELNPRVGSSGRLLVRNVRAQADNLITVQVPSRANCLLKSKDEASAGLLELPANEEGWVAFHVTPRAVGTIINDVLECKDPLGTSATTTLELRATADATIESPPRLPERIRPALTGDPMSLTQQQLHQRGFPTRPDPQTQSDAYSTWLRNVSRPMTQLRRARLVSLRQRNAAFTPNWVGVESNRTTSSSAYLAATANWYVPQSIPNNSGQTNAVAFWVGIGGYGSNGGGMWQGGTEEHVVWPGGSAHSTKFPWVEFINASGPCCIQNLWSEIDFPIQAGDLYQFEVLLGDSAMFPTITTGRRKDSTQHLWYYHANLTRGWQIGWESATVQEFIDQFNFFKPGNTIPIVSGITGGTTEWIAERPTFDTGYAPLPNFGPYAEMSNPQSFDRATWAWSLYDFRPHQLIHMRNTALQTLATGSYGPPGSSGGLVGFNWLRYQ